jgi:hypothetical protein
MNDEEKILERYLYILCNDFVVDRKPRLLYIPSEKKVGIVGVYDAKTETIILHISEYDALIHEFIHHLQYEECGYDYSKYISKLRAERHKPYFKREYEIEAHKVEAVLSEIYKDTFKQGINAEPLGNDGLAELLVARSITKFTITEQMLEEAIDYTTAVIVTEDFTRLADVYALSILAYNEYESIMYLLKYTARTYYLKWHIPELEDLNRETREIMKRLDICKDMSSKYTRLPYAKKRSEINRLVDLQMILSDTLQMCYNLKMHYLDVFSREPFEESS